MGNVSQIVDSLGRVTLPKKSRDQLNFKYRDRIEFQIIDDNSIVCKRITRNCIFCGCQEEMRVIKGKLVCCSCLNGLKNLEVE
jgi:transcriptional pleiotropic regulator of transition state genes